MRPSLVVLCLSIVACGGISAEASAEPVSRRLPMTFQTNLAPGSRHFLTFSLFDAATGGNKLWTETTRTKLAVSPSRTVQWNLGSIVPFDNGLSGPVDFSRQLWVQCVGGGKTFPRVKLAAVPYALWSVSSGPSPALAGKRCPVGESVVGFDSNGELVCEPCGCTSQVLLADGFESYVPGGFPTSGGWTLRYDGAGANLQLVDATRAASGGQSLRLEGSSCWGAQAHKPLQIPQRVRYEARVYVNAVTSCGCSPQLAAMGFVDPDLSTWGTWFGGVFFQCDGKVYAKQSTFDNARDRLLMPYVAGRWYHVAITADFSARLFDVSIDGVSLATGLQIVDDGTPSGIEVTAQHGGHPTVWYDDVRVTSLPAATP